MKYLPGPPNVALLRALWYLLDGIWGLLKGSWGVLVGFKIRNRNYGLACMSFAFRYLTLGVKHW